MASIKSLALKITMFTLLIFCCVEARAKFMENSSEEIDYVENEPHRISGGVSLLFADEFKLTLEKYLFGMCPQTFKMVGKSRNSTAPACDLDPEQHDLAGRLAALSLRAHSASRIECARFGTILANTLAELARTAANKPQYNGQNENLKKRKLSKSQKAKIQAKQKTALAVKKKAAALAAAAAAKITS